MPSNENLLELASNLLVQAQSALTSIEIPKPNQSAADLLVTKLELHVDDTGLSDAEFRSIARKGLLEVLANQRNAQHKLPTERQVVRTNIGNGYVVNGMWYKFWAGKGSKEPMPDQSEVISWKYIQGMPIVPE